jgi:trehalose-6-phosphate synthase
LAHFPWTRNVLHNLVSSNLRGIKFIVVSNREPYIHSHSKRGIRYSQPASGMASALDPILRASEGTWIAHGSGSADRDVVDNHDRVGVPPDAPAYTLRRVWLDQRLEQEYYYGLANQGLWPLCHMAFHRPSFQKSHWQSYQRANQIFADAVIEEAGDGPAFVFIQDYHFGLLPRMLKDRKPNLIVSQFWHIPWPNCETFRAFPWREEILHGLLGNDLLGFQLQYHCVNFLDTVEREVEALVDSAHRNVIRGGKQTMVRSFPISIDFENHNQVAATLDIDAHMEAWLGELGGNPQYLGIGIDRIDYTKGIPERLQAIDLFLTRYPEYRGKLVFAQIGVPSREGIAGYRNLSAELDQQVEALNCKWGTRVWKPILFLKRNCEQACLMALHRLADFCIVSSLHDGMNLVAKEFVSSRFDEDGVLILSSFTGSARELTDALIVNPFAPDEISEAIAGALTMSREDRRRRMTRLRAAVAENNIYRWAGKILSTLMKCEIPDTAQMSAAANSLVGAAR